MENEISIFDVIYDENNDDNIVLYNTKDEPVEFEQVAFIPFEEKDYVILKPVTPFEGMKEDEALVFEMVEDENGESIVVVIDEEIIDAVFNEYNALYDQLSEE